MYCKKSQTAGFYSKKYCLIFQKWYNVIKYIQRRIIMELKNKKIVFLGDSITEGHGVEKPENRYVDRVANQTGAICKNFGISGTRIAKQTIPSPTERYDQDFISRVDEMDADADVVVVFGGTNDWGHGDAKIGSFDNRDEYTFYGALHTLYTKLIEKFPASQIVVLTPLHRTNEAGPVIRPEMPQSNKALPLKYYVEIIREMAEYYSIPVLDLFKTSGIQPEIPVIKEKYIPDGLHPNDEGHALLANRIIKFLETL